MRTADKFTVFCNNLRMSDIAISNIHYRYKKVVAQINAEFRQLNNEVDFALYVGSYGRGTAIHVGAVDVLVELPNTALNRPAGDSPLGVLQTLCRAIAVVYPKARVEAPAGAVALQFDDGIGFNFIPGFLDADNQQYICPLDVKQGTWQLLNPLPEIDAMARADVLTIKNVRRLCRIMRVWKAYHQLPMGGLLLDSLAHDFITQWKYRDKSYSYFDWMCRDFFLYLKNLNAEVDAWPALGSEQPLLNVGGFSQGAARCYELAQAAITHEHNKQGWLVNYKWLEIFGERFLD